MTKSLSLQTNTLLGHLTEVHNSGLKAQLVDETDQLLSTMKLGGNQVIPGQIGSYVAIVQFNIKVLAIITSMTEQGEPPGKSLSLSKNSQSKRIITMIPLGEVNRDGAFENGVKHFPTTGAEVHIVNEEDIKSIFVKFRSQGYSIGTLSSHSSMDVCVDPAALFGRHFAVLGQSGSGKSWTTASLIQRAVKTMPKSHIIVLDLHGEYCWKDQEGRIQSAFNEDVVRYVDARDLEIPYWLMTFAELVDLLIDRADKTASSQIAFLRETVHDLRIKANKRLNLGHISIDSPVYFSLDEMLQYFKSANEMTTNFGKTKGPLTGQFDQFLMRLQSRLNDNRYDFLLKPQYRNSSDSLEGLLRDFVGLGEPKRQVTVIDLSSIPFDVRPTISAQIGRLAFEFNYWNPRYMEFPILLVCEEAHAYIPRESGTQFEGTRKSMERIAKEGRKYGVGLAVVSQRPHELSETVLAQCGTFFCLRLTNPADQNYIRSLVPESERDITDILAALGRGEAMALGLALPLPTRLQFYRPDPVPNSADADFYTHWKAGPDDLDVDLIIERWRRQERS